MVAAIEGQDLEESLVCWNSLIQGGSVIVDAVEDGNQENPLELISNPSLHKWGIRSPERARILLNIT